MLRVIVFLVFLGVLSGANAQKVSFKKDMVLVDKTPFIKKADGSSFFFKPTVFATLGDKKIFSTIPYKYVGFGKIYKPASNSFVDGDVEKTYFQIKFFDSDKTMFTSQQLERDIIRSIFKSKVFDENGKLDEKNLEDFIKSYGEEKDVIVRHSH